MKMIRIRVGVRSRVNIRAKVRARVEVTVCFLRFASVFIASCIYLDHEPYHYA